MLTPELAHLDHALLNISEAQDTMSTDNQHAFKRDASIQRW